MISVNSTTLMVLWNQPPLIDHNGQLAVYVIKYTRVGLGDIMMTMTITGTTVLIPGLVENTDYSVRVETGSFSNRVLQATGIACMQNVQQINYIT